MNSVAVIVVDMLRDYFDQDLWPTSEIPGDERRLCDNINRLTNAARLAGARVVWVRQEFKPDLADAFPHMRRTGRAYTIRGTDGCRLVPGLVTHTDDAEVIKKRFSAFFQTGLADDLSAGGVTTVLLAGITTAWCIRATATDAYQLGFDVVLVSDCMAAFRGEDHDRALRDMAGYIAEEMNSTGAATALAGLPMRDGLDTFDL